MCARVLVCMICIHNSICTDSRRSLDAKGYDRLQFVEGDMTVAGKVSSISNCFRFLVSKLFICILLLCILELKIRNYNIGNLSFTISTFILHYIVLYF